ncbi:MAG: LLM class flavin-dependent oxidoreductase [Actinobacteria bacterium]|nr:LLM class flavin-dependent oxidoreductase [Actinomycetota bacterium]
MAARDGIRVGLGLTGLDGLVERARELEAADFDFLSCGEHVFFHGPTPNALVALAAAAGATTRIRLLSAITILPLYPPPLAAKMASVLDVVSGGRFDFGIGVGGEIEKEFSAIGVPVRERGRRTDEALEVVAKLFSPGEHSFAGEFTSFDGCRLQPPPAQAGGPPIWVAGRSEAAMRRAGRFGSVWMPYMYTPEKLATSLAVVREEAERNGRDPAAVRGAIFAFVCIDEDGDAARAAAVEAVGHNYRQDFSRLGHYLVAGTPRECAARIGEYTDAGAEAVQLQLGCAPDAEQGVYEALRDELLPLLRGTA